MFVGHNELAKIVNWYYTIRGQTGRPYTWVNGSGKMAGYLEDEKAQVDNSIMMKRKERMNLSQAKVSVSIHWVFVYALAVCLFLPSPRVGLANDEINREVVFAAQPAQPTVNQPAPLIEMRDEKKGDVTVSVQSLDDVMKVMTSQVPGRLEVNVQPVTAAQAEKYGLRPNQGVVIIWLDPKGPLGRTGLATSDIILQIDNQPVEGLASFISQVNSLGTLQPANFSVVDHRTGRIHNVRIVIRPERHPQEPKGNFVVRNFDAAVAGVQKTAQAVQQQISYAADAGKEAITDLFRGLKRWAGMTEKPPVASIKKGEELRAKPPRPPEKEAGGPG